MTSSFSTDVLKDKLLKLNETQASIVGLSQWILIHYKHASSIAQIWRDTLTAAPEKAILPLVYVANDVIQQLRARRKTEFIQEFSTVFIKCLPQAYSKVTSKTIRQKIRRSVTVWKERRVVSDRIISALLAEFDKSDKEGPAVPSKLEALSSKYTRLTDNESKLKQNLTKFNKEYNVYFSEDSNLPGPAMFINKIQNLLRMYNEGVAAKFEAVKTERRAIIDELERLIAVERLAMEGLGNFEDFSALSGLDAKHKKMTKTMKELEEMVLADNEGISETIDFVPEDQDEPVNDDDAIPTYVDSDEDLEEPAQKKQKKETEEGSATATTQAADEEYSPMDSAL